MIHPPSIFEYITAEENRFAADEIRVFDNWPWNFRNHVQMSLSLKHGMFMRGENNWMRPFKKVIQPILRRRYAAEDIELKDVMLYVEDDDERALSFLIKKYHDEVFVKENDLDSFFDEASEENIDLGGVLVQKTGTAKPEVLPLQFVAFCDQTDILGGPIAFKYYFSPDKLRGMVKLGWGESQNGATVSLNELITLSQPVKDPSGQRGQKENITTGKNIEVYILRGSLPQHYLEDNDNMEDYSYQLHIVGFYADKKGNRVGMTLYRKQADESTLKFHTSKAVRGRALGEGGAEDLFHEQIWTNFLEIHKTNLLESASKVPLYTDDASYAARNKIQEMENLEVTVVAEGKAIRQVPTAAPVNIQLFERGITEWWQNAQLIGAAQDPLLGKQSFAGMTFRGQERLLTEGRSTHEYRRGKFAKFVEEIYRDWIIPYIVKQVLKEKKFLATLSSEEMQWVMDRMVENKANKLQIEQILNKQTSTPKEVLIAKFKAEFAKGGNKRPLEILKDEFRDAKIKVSVTVAGKQKDLASATDKLVQIFRFIFANPQGFQQVMQMPGMAKSFNDILEFSGISPIDFAGVTELPQQAVSSQPVEQLLTPATTS